MHAAALTENIDSHCFTEIQNPAQKSYCTPPQVLPTGLFYNSTEFPWNKAGYFKDLRAVIKNKLHFFPQDTEMLLWWLGAQQPFNCCVDVTPCCYQCLQVCFTVQKSHGTELFQLLLEPDFWALQLRVHPSKSLQHLLDKLLVARLSSAPWGARVFTRCSVGCIVCWRASRIACCPNTRRKPWDEAGGFCCQCLQALLDLQQCLHSSRVWHRWERVRALHLRKKRNSVTKG